jgi:hypothetical protein
VGSALEGAAVVKRSELEALKSEIRTGRPLDEFQWWQLTKILETIIAGYDVRQDFGIKPKRGARPSTQASQKFIVRHFLALCTRAPNLPEKTHRGMVAKAWNRPDNEVAKLIRKWRNKLRFSAADAEFTLENLDILISQSKRRTRNSRN